MSEGLYKRAGSKSWQMRFAGPDGRIIRESAGTANKKDAQTRLAIRKSQVAEGKFGIRSKTRYTFAEICTLWWDYHGKDRRSAAGLKGICDVLKEYLGDMRADEITGTQIDLVLKTIVARRGLSESTRNRYLTTIKSMFNWAMGFQLPGSPALMASNPAKRLRVTDETKFERSRFLSREEIRRLLGVCGSSLRPIVLAALHTGMRRGELLALTWKDIDFETGIVHVRESKSGRPRRVPLTATLHFVLEGLHSANSSTLGASVFVRGEPKNDGRKVQKRHVVDAGWLHSRFQKAREEAGLEQTFRFHDLRHTFASHLAMSGIDLLTVRDLLGHSSVQMTERYAHLSPSHRTRAVSILDATTVKDAGVQPRALVTQIGYAALTLEALQEGVAFMRRPVSVSKLELRARHQSVVSLIEDLAQHLNEARRLAEKSGI